MGIYTRCGLCEATGKPGETHHCAGVSVRGSAAEVSFEYPATIQDWHCNACGATQRLGDTHQCERLGLLIPAITPPAARAVKPADAEPDANLDFDNKPDLKCISCGQPTDWEGFCTTCIRYHLEGALSAATDHLLSVMRAHAVQIRITVDPGLECGVEFSSFVRRWQP